jgi:hypothetical protein
MSQPGRSDSLPAATANGRNRRVSPIASGRGDGLLSDHRAGAQLGRQELVFMPLFGLSSRGRNRSARAVSGHSIGPRCRRLPRSEGVPKESRLLPKRLPYLSRDSQSRLRSLARIPLFSLWYGLAKLTAGQRSISAFHASPSWRGGADASAIGTGKQGPFRCATQRSPKQAPIV